MMIIWEAPEKYEGKYVLVSGTDFNCTYRQFTTSSFMANQMNIRRFMTTIRM